MCPGAAGVELLGTLVGKPHGVFAGSVAWLPPEGGQLLRLGGDAWGRTPVGSPGECEPHP